MKIKELVSFSMDFSKREIEHLFCRNGFQRLDKIKDTNRQSKQLEELAEKMRDCKRFSFSPRYRFFTRELIVASLASLE